MVQGSPWTEVEVEVERTEQGASARKVGEVRVTRAEEVEIERWRNGGVDYELMRQLFGVGLPTWRLRDGKQQIGEWTNAQR